MHRADARAGQHGDRRFGNHRQINNDAIAFVDLVSLQHIGEPANFVMQLLISQRPFLARLAFPDDGRFVPARAVEMSIQAILGDVQFSADEPFGERRFPLQDFFPRRAPNQFARLARPKSCWLCERFSMQPPVMRADF